MKEKLKDAWKDLRKEIYEEQQMWRQLKKTINNRSKINEYNATWYKEETKNFEELRDKRRQSI